MRRIFTKKRETTKRLVALLIAFVMVVGYLPISSVITNATEPAEKSVSIPQKPIGNKDYADFMQVHSSGDTKFENGKAYSTSTSAEPRVRFDMTANGAAAPLPFTKDDTYVFGFDVVTTEAQKGWHSARAILGAVNNQQLELQFRGDCITLFQGDAQKWSEPFTRELGTTYRIDILVEPTVVSVWVDGSLVVDNQLLPDRTEMRTGVKFSYVKATVSNIDLYYTAAEDVSGNPQLPAMPDGNKDYADYMAISTSSNYTFGDGILSAVSADRATSTTYGSLPFGVNDTYVYGFNLTTKVADANYKSARVTLGAVQDGSSTKTLRMFFLGDSIGLYKDGDYIWGTRFNRALGETYRVDILVEPTSVSLWVNNAFVKTVNNLPTKAATTTGVQFENTVASLSDIDLYYTTAEDFSSNPQLPIMLEGNKDYADYMTIGSSDYYTFKNGTLASNSAERAASVTFGNLPFAKEDTYVYGFNLTTKEADANYKSARVILGKVQDGSGTKTLRMFFLGNNIGLYKDGDCIWETRFNRALGETYRVDILVEPNTISLWIDRVYVATINNLPDKTATTTGVLFENAKVTMLDFDLYYTTEEVFPAIPEKPVINKDYADYMTIGSSDYYTFKKGTLASNSTEHAVSTTFGNLPFGVDDTYVYGFNLTTEEADANYKSARVILGKVQDGSSTKTLRMYFMGDSIQLFKDNDWMWQTRFDRELGKKYRIDFLIEPNAISFWIDGLYMDTIDIALEKAATTTGVLFENAKVTMSDFDLYYTEIEDFPAIPKKPETNKDYADYMTVGINREKADDCVYADGVLSSQTAERTPSATFGNLPFGVDDTYVYGFNLTTEEADANYKSARVVLGKVQDGSSIKTLRMYFMGDSIQLFKDNDWMWQTRFDRELGKKYRIDYVIEPNAISFWIDGLYMDTIDIALEKAATTTGVLFENAKVTMSDFDLYYVETEVFPTIPKKPKTNKDYADYMTVGINREKADDCVYVDGVLASQTTERTPSATFGNIPFGTSDTYVFGFDLVTEEADANYKSARIILGTIQDGDTAKTLRMFFLGDSIGLYKNNDEIWRTTFKREIGKTYRVDFLVEANVISLWIDGMYMDTIENLPNKTKITTGVLFEKAKASISNIDLYYVEEEVFPTIPEKPVGNADYADYMKITKNPKVYTYENGKLSFLSDANAGRVTFKELPFAVNETYVFGFDLKTERADKNWKSARVMLGKVKDGDKEKELMMYFLGDSVGLYKGVDAIWQIPFERELGATYRVDLLIEPNAISVWINKEYIDTISNLPDKTVVTTGIQFEYAKATISNIDLYYTEYVAFTPPQPLVYKELADGQYNAADWMSVTLKGSTYNGYFGNKLTSNTTSEALKYKFNNMPVTDEMSYYYSATYKITESDANHKGPRFIFRQDGSTELQVAITKNEVVLLLGGKALTGVQFESKVGQSYDIVMYSTPTKISVWIDGRLILEEFDLTSHVSSTPLSAKMGLLFEYCKATVTNIAIYGDEIVFNKDYVDPVLYYDKYYTMDSIPAMRGLNLFQNITMRDQSNGESGAKFDKTTNVLETEYSNGKGSIAFVDANGSSNLNGLKNHTGYVFAFTYEVDEWQAESAGQSEFWVRTNRSAGEWTTKLNGIQIGFSGTALVLQVHEEGKMLMEQVVAFPRKNDTKYDIAIVHGGKWIKLYVDNELKMVSTQLPSYDIDFNFSLNNMKAKFTNFKLYEFEDSGLSILETVKKPEAMELGNTIVEAAEYTSFSEMTLPALVIVVCSTIASFAILGIVIALLYNAKHRKKESEIGGEKV